MNGTDTASSASLKRDARVGESAGIHDREIDRLGGKGLDPVDQFVLGIALEAQDGRIALPGERRKALFDRRKRHVAVPARFPAAEQIEIGPIDQQDPMHRRHSTGQTAICPEKAPIWRRSASI